MAVINVTYELNKFLLAQENAEPATYSISETFNKNRDRTSHNTGKVSFQSRQPKCIERIPDNPGTSYLLPPTSYSFPSLLLFHFFVLFRQISGRQRRDNGKENKRRKRMNAASWKIYWPN